MKWRWRVADAGLMLLFAGCLLVGLAPTLGTWLVWVGVVALFAPMVPRRKD